MKKTILIILSIVVFIWISLSLVFISISSVYRTINIQDQIDNCVVHKFVSIRGVSYVVCSDEKILIPPHKKLVEKGIGRRIRKGDIIIKKENSDSIIVKRGNFKTTLIINTKK